MMKAKPGPYGRSVPKRTPVKKSIDSENIHTERILKTRDLFEIFCLSDHGKILTARQLEKLFVRRFNKHTNLFPSDVSPQDLLTEFIDAGYIKKCECGKNYLIK